MADPVSLVAQMIARNHSARDHSAASTSSHAAAPRPGAASSSPAHARLLWHKPSLSPSSSVSHPDTNTNTSTPPPFPSFPWHPAHPGTSAAELHELAMVERLLAGLPPKQEPGVLPMGAASTAALSQQRNPHPHPQPHPQPPSVHPGLASGTHLHRASQRDDPEPPGLNRCAAAAGRPLPSSAQEILFGLAMQEREREREGLGLGAPGVRQGPAGLPWGADVCAGAGAGAGGGGSACTGAGGSPMERLLAQSSAGDLAGGRGGDLAMKQMQLQRLQMALGPAVGGDGRRPIVPPAASQGLSPELMDLLLRRSSGRFTPDYLTTLSGDSTPGGRMPRRGGPAAGENPWGAADSGGGGGVGYTPGAQRPGGPGEASCAVAPLALQERLLREQLLLQLTEGSRAGTEAHSGEGAGAATEGGRGREPCSQELARRAQLAHAVSLSPARRRGGGSSSSGGAPMDMAIDGMDAMEGGAMDRYAGVPEASGNGTGEELSDPADDVAQAKRLRRLAGNREAARRLRKRQTERLTDLEEQVSKLRRAHSETLGQLQRARTRVDVLTRENLRLEQAASDLRTAIGSCGHQHTAPRQQQHQLQQEQQHRQQQEHLQQELLQQQEQQQQEEQRKEQVPGLGAEAGGAPQSAPQDYQQQGSASATPLSWAQESGAPCPPPLTEMWPASGLDDDLWALPSDSTC